MINELPYIDLQNHIDLTEFDNLLPKICRGIATAHPLAIYGLQVYHEGTVHPLAQGIEIKALSQVYSYWKSLPDNNPFKQAGENLTYNELTNYLKYSLHAYDHYTVYQVLDQDYKYKGPGEIATHFPELVKWIEQFKERGIFKSLFSATIMAIDSGGIPWEHHDPEDPKTAIFDPTIPEENRSGEVAEFIHIKTDCDRPFYIIHPETEEKIYINTRVAWWDERDWHGGEPIQRPTFTLRINGRFTDEFKKQINVEGYDKK
jgi:hypothetical protein